MVIKNYTKSKRLFAYLIDITLIMFVSAMFCEIPLINPYFDEYTEKSEEYLEYIDSLESNYENADLEILTNYTYDLSYYDVYNSIITVVISFLYFSVFQFLNDGKTVGKAMMNLKLVSKKGKRIKFYQTLIRSFLINSILVSILSILSIFFLEKNICIQALSIIQFFDTVIIITCLIMLSVREDGYGLHDILSNSKVIDENPLILINKSVKNANKKIKKYNKDDIM